MGKTSHEKTYRIIQTCSIIGLFASVALVVMMTFGFLPSNSVTLCLVSIVAIISTSCMLIMPWIKQLGRGEFKTLCYVMFGLTIACCLLWIADIIAMTKMLNGNNSDSANFVIMRFLKISLIISFQFIVANTIASTFVRFKKSMIAFQVITYISNLYIDLYGSYALACIQIANGDIKFVGNAQFVTSKISVMFAVMALLFVVISAAVIQRMDKRRRADTLAPIYEDVKKSNSTETQSAEKIESPAQSVQEKLKELKSLFDNNLITEEEYEKKRQEYLNQL